MFATNAKNEMFAIPIIKNITFTRIKIANSEQNIDISGHIKVKIELQIPLILERNSSSTFWMNAEEKQTFIIPSATPKTNIEDISIMYIHASIKLKYGTKKLAK